MERDLNVEFLFDLKKKGCKSVVEWCMNLGLIATAYKCHKCGRRMILSEIKDAQDGCEWRCRTYGVNGHEVKLSIRKGSWFSESKLSIIEILIVTYYWVNKLPTNFIMRDLRLNSEKVIDWIHFCGELCMGICESESSVLGGVGVQVEVYRSKIGTRKMFKKKSDNANWVLGGLEKVTRKLFFTIVEKIDKEVLLDMIKTYILPGTILASDCWKTYKCLDDEEFIQFIKSQSLYLREPDIVQAANVSDFSLAIIKHQAGKENKYSDRFDFDLAETMWRTSQNNEETIETFLEALLKVYPPRKES